MTREVEPSADQPLPELLKTFVDQSTTLMRQELELAKAEVTQKAKQGGVGIGMFGGAGVFGILAVGALTTCFILALAIVMPAALAALAVAVVYGLIAAVLALQGKRRVKQATPPVPEEAVESVKEDVQWLKNQRQSGAR